MSEKGNFNNIIYRKNIKRKTRQEDKDGDGKKPGQREIM